MERRNLLAGLAVLALSLFVLSGTAFAHAAHHKKAKPHGEGPTAQRKRAWFTRCPSRSWTRASSAAPRASPTSSKSSAKKSTPRSTSGSAPTSSTAVATKGSTGVRRTSDARRRVGAVQRPELLGRTRQRRQRDRDRDRRALVCGRRKPDRSAPRSGAVHDGDDRLHGAAAAADRPRACSSRRKARSRARSTATWRRSSRSSSRPCSPRNRSTCTARSCTRAATSSPHTEAIVMGETATRRRSRTSKKARSYLDNDGNAFVVVIGNSSCASGTSLIEASLENAPYTTYTTNFTIEPPQPTFPE